MNGKMGIREIRRAMADRRLTAAALIDRSAERIGTVGQPVRT